MTSLNSMTKAQLVEHSAALERKLHESAWLLARMRQAGAMHPPNQPSLPDVEEARRPPRPAPDNVKAYLARLKETHAKQRTPTLHT